MTDGRYDSRWQSAQDVENQSFTIDLQKEVKIAKVQMEFEYFDRFYLYDIQYSTDGETWNMYADYTERAWKGYQTRTSEKNASARYIKVNIKRAERGYTSLWEVKVLSEK